MGSNISHIRGPSPVFPIGIEFSVRKVGSNWPFMPTIGCNLALPFDNRTNFKLLHWPNYPFPRAFFTIVAQRSMNSWRSVNPFGFDICIQDPPVSARYRVSCDCPWRIESRRRKPLPAASNTVQSVFARWDFRCLTMHVHFASALSRRTPSIFLKCLALLLTERFQDAIA